MSRAWSRKPRRRVMPPGTDSFDIFGAAGSLHHEEHTFFDDDITELPDSMLAKEPGVASFCRWE